MYHHKYSYKHFSFLCLLAANLFTLAVLVRKGYKLKILMRTILEGIKGCGSIFIIILLMGATVATWLSSGVVPSMIYYGFNYVAGYNLVVIAFLFSMMMSYVMGTAVGTISTIGIAILAVGKGLMIPVPVLLGAVISGAFIADKVAPISSLNNLTLKITNTQYKDYLKSALKTLVPTIALSAIIYYILGNLYQSNGDVSKVYAYQKLMVEAFLVSPYLLLFPVLVVILAFFGFKASHNMAIGVFLASIVTVFVQKIPVLTLGKAILLGYQSRTGMPELDSLVSGGGILPMFEVVLIVMGSIALSSLFEKANLLKPLVDALFKEEDNRFSLIAKTGLLSCFLTAATCDQTVGIIIPVKVAMERFEKLRIHNSVLARTVSDTGTIVAPLMPWNINAIIISSVIGISAMEYAPFAVLCFLNPIVMLLEELIGGRRIRAAKQKAF